MQEFIIRFKEATFEDDVYLKLNHISENDNDLIMIFNVYLYSSDEVIQNWKTTCKNFENYKLINEFIEDIDIS